MTDTETSTATSSRPGVAQQSQPVVSAVNTTTNKGGRPTKYEPETVDRLLGALADGLTLKQACTASSISESTLSDWRERHPELEARLTQAREQARQRALAGIKAAGEAGDWRALESFLRMSFQADYRRDASVSVTATATAQQASMVITEEQQQRLIAQRERLLREVRSKKEEVRELGQNALQSPTGTGKGIVAQNQSPATKPDPVVLEMESIGNAASWKHGKGSEPENHAGSFGPWPEEYE